MNFIKKYKLPVVISLLLIGSIFLNIIDAQNPNAILFKQDQSEKVAEKVLTRAKSLNEKLILPINDTTIEMKLDRAETSTVTINDDTKGTTTKQIYFQVFATVKNTGTKPFSFHSNPVFGVSNDNFILLAKNSVSSNDENKVTINTEGLSPNQNTNFLHSSVEIKPGTESSGFFLFESEVQTLQMISNGTSYIWHTMKSGANIQGREITTDTPISNSNKTLNFRILEQETVDYKNKKLNVVHISMTNSSDEVVTPFSFIPKYGVTIPGEVAEVEKLDTDITSQFKYPTIDEKTKLDPDSTQHYIIAFQKNVAFIFIQPPLTDNYTNLRISL